MPTTSGSKKKSARGSGGVDYAETTSTAASSTRKTKKSKATPAAEKPELSNEANFPPCYPIIRHSLGDLLSPLKKVCAIYAMILWAVNLVVLVLNFVGSFFYLASTTAEENSLIMLLVSLLYVVVIPVPNIIFQYWPVYLACRSGNALMYALYVICTIVAVAFNAVMMLGVPYLGSCGVLTIIVVVAKGHWVSVGYHFVVLCCWLVLIVMQLIGIVLMYPNYKSDNGNLVELQHQLFDKIKGLRSKAALGGVRNVV